VREKSRNLSDSLADSTAVKEKALSQEGSSFSLKLWKTSKGGFVSILHELIK
jgi:hypothetical protein